MHRILVLHTIVQILHILQSSGTKVGGPSPITVLERLCGVHRDRARSFVGVAGLEKRLSGVFRVPRQGGVLVIGLLSIAVAVQYIMLEHEKEIEEDGEQRQPDFPKVACNNNNNNNNNRRKNKSGLGYSCCSTRIFEIATFKVAERMVMHCLESHLEKGCYAASQVQQNVADRPPDGGLSSKVGDSLRRVFARRHDQLYHVADVDELEDIGL